MFEFIQIPKWLETLSQILGEKLNEWLETTANQLINWRM